MNIFHTFNPDPIVFQIGNITIYWYGLLIAIGAFLAYMVIFYISKKILKDSNLFSQIENLIIYLIAFGLIGARLYHVLTHLSYYFKKPLEIFYIWQGGLGIFGAILAGILVLFFFNKKHPVLKNKFSSFLRITDILAPGVILAQAIGRWGNFFNQELFGFPVSWGIPISSFKRPDIFASFKYFHPTFLYESIWNLLVFIFLILMVHRFIKKRPGFITGFYLILYPLGRFTIEFIRVDKQPQILGLRTAQVFSIFLILIGCFLLFKSKKIKF